MTKVVNTEMNIRKTDIIAQILNGWILPGCRYKKKKWMSLIY